MELFNYKGREWFNVGTGLLLLFGINIAQLLWTIVSPSTVFGGAPIGGLWIYFAVYGPAFGMLALAALSKKPFTALMANISTLLMLLVAISKYINKEFIQNINITTLILTPIAYVAIIIFVIGLADFFFDFTKEKLPFSNYMLVSCFVMILGFAALQMYFGTYRTGNEAIVWMAKDAILIGFCVTAILSLIKEAGDRIAKSIPIDEATISNIAFLFAFGLLLFAFGQWSILKQMFNVIGS